MTAKRDADHVTPLKTRSKRQRGQYCVRGHAARATTLAKRYQQHSDEVDEMVGVEASSSNEGYVSGSEDRHE
jgi:hypothetical protein